MESANVNLGQEGSASSVPPELAKSQHCTMMAVPDSIYYRENIPSLPSGREYPEPISLKTGTVSNQVPVVVNGSLNGASDRNILQYSGKAEVVTECCDNGGDKLTSMPPPKKKWIREYLEEEPQSPVLVTTMAPRNGLVAPHATSPAAPSPVAPPPAPHSQSSYPIDYLFEHSRPRNDCNGQAIPSVASNTTIAPAAVPAGSSPVGGARAGTREVHNKLEKNRRAHLKECFELLKRQLPASADDKKTSNLSILGSAIRYIQVLRRKERECEHEMERLAREKIAAQQRLSALRRDITSRQNNHRHADICDERERDERVNGQVLGLPISMASVVVSGASPPASPTRTLNLSTKLRTLPIQITPSKPPVINVQSGGAARRSPPAGLYARANGLNLAPPGLLQAKLPGAHLPTLTVTAVSPAQSGQATDNGMNPALGTALVHPAHLHLPLSQVVTSGGLVVSPAALQLLSAPPGALRVLQAQPSHMQTNGCGSNRIRESPRLMENGTVTPPPSQDGHTGLVVGGLAPLVVSQAGAHLLAAAAPSHLSHKLHTQMETSSVKSSGMQPLAVSAQYLGTAALVKPVVVVSSAPSTST